MLLKVFSKRLLRVSLISNQIPINKRWFHCFNCKSKLIEYHFKSNKLLILTERLFCEKSGHDLSDGNRTSNLKVTKESQKMPDIVVQKIPKTNEFFYMVTKKPYELVEWVAKTPKEKKKNLLFSGIIKIIKVIVCIQLVGLVYYYFHQDINPLTGRQCLYSIPQQMVDEIESDIFKEIFTQNMESGSFLPSTHAAVKRLDRVVDHIIESNSDLDLIGDGIWTSVVINDNRICDLIVLKESRNIFIYKKLLDLCESDDELAYVLSHQLSHVMLNHSKEPMAYTSLLYLPFVAFLPQIWALSREPMLHWVDTIDTFFENKIKNFLRKIITFSAYNEKLEEEADRIAMQLMTRSCYDIRKCRQFCKKFRYITESNGQSTDNTREDGFDYQFFVKHPINDNKLLYLFQYIKPFVELRKRCNCQPLI